MASLKDWFSRKKPANYYYFDSSYIQPILDYSAERLYETQPHLRTVIDFLSLNIAQLPLKVYSDKDGIRERNKDSKIAQLIRRPNIDQTTFEFIQETVNEICLYDKCIWAVIPDNNTECGWQMRVMPNKWIVSEFSTNPYSVDKVTFTAQNSSLGQIEIDSKDLVIFHGWKPGNPRTGVSPVESLKQTLSEQISSMEFRESIWKNGGRFNQYISRPKDVAPLDETQAEKFRKNFSAAYTRGGSKAGGLPLLEDGMEIKQSQFNSKDAQWIESVKLSLKTCASAYHVNPYFVGDTEGKTYASVKEASRSLYNDTLAPKLAQIEQRINEFLIPKIGESSEYFVEFDLNAKLAGSFEEQAAVLSSSVGGPWLKRNEARTKLNLPPVEGGDELITPLNVVTGGLSSPRDTSELSLGEMSSDVQHKYHDGCHFKIKSASLSTKPKKKDSEKLQKIIEDHIDRQRRSILPRIKSSADIWDSERWDAELADDLESAIDKMSDGQAVAMVKRMGVEPSNYNTSATRKYLRNMAEMRAQAINEMTKNNLMASLNGDFEEDAEGSTPEGAFEKSKNQAFDKAFAIACGVFAFATAEAVKQCAKGAKNVTKTWITNPSKDPRSEHAMVDGETVPYNDLFSNGAFRPHDYDALGADGVANCHCSMEITIP